MFDETVQRKAGMIPALVLLLVVLGMLFPTVKAEAASIQEGYYILSSATNKKEYMEIDGAKTSNGAIVETNTWYGGAHAVFHITKEKKKGYYRITSFYTGKVLEVKNGSKKKKTALQQNVYNGKKRQQWKIKSAGKGYYYLQSRVGTYVTTANKKAVDGGRAIMNPLSKKKTQKWKLVKLSSYVYAPRTPLSFSSSRAVKKVAVKAFGNWSVSSNRSWIHVSKDSKELSITVDANTGSRRTGTITLSGASNTRTISVTQEAGKATSTAPKTTSTTKTSAPKTTTTSATSTATPAITAAIRLKTYMTVSMSQHDHMGWGGCLSTAYAIGYSIVNKKNYDPDTFWNGSSGVDVYHKTTEVKGSDFSAFYNNLKSGKPILAHYYTKSSQHWVAVIGVKAGANTSALKASDFIAIDPADGKEKLLTDCWGFNGTVANYKKF